MSDQPPPIPPSGDPGDPEDPWDAWRGWSTSGPSDPSAAAPWDAWKTWQWDPGAARRFSAGSSGPPGCSVGALKALIVVVITFFFFASILGDVLGGAEELPADELIAAIDALPVTGPRDQRPPDRSAGETATFPAPDADPASVASAIAAVRPPEQREQSDASSFLLYEEATVTVQPAPGGGPGSEVVVFEDNRDATRRFPILLGFPGWGVRLDDFDSRARSRGGIGGFQGGGGGFAK